MTTAIPTQHEYEARERQMLNDHLHMIEALPVYERRGAFYDFLPIAVIVLANTTLFEDGSIQFFNMIGWGFCILPIMGC